MAEVLGLIGSGITVAQLAGQVAGRVIELKSLWNLVKDVPSDVKDHLVQVESINLILSHIQHDHGPETRPGKESDNIYIQRSLHLCKEGADKLGAAVSDLSDKIRGKTGWRLKIGSMKIVLKKDDLQRLREKMKSAIDLLSFAYQCHTAAMIQAQPDIIVARLLSFATPEETVAKNPMETNPHSQKGSPPNAEDLTSENLVEKHYRHWASSSSWLIFLLGSFEYRKRCSIRRQVIDAKFKVPAWISDRVWDCRGQKTLSGWKLILQAYRVLAFEHPLFRYARSGDVTGIQDLLSRREISVTDRQIWTGSTALHIAASRGHHEICKILISEGADVLSVDFRDGTPLHKTVETAAFVTFTGRGQAWEVSRLLINAGAGHAIIDDVDVFTRFEGPKAMFRYLLQQVYPPYYTRSMCERFMIIEHLSSLDWHNTPDLMRLAICNGPLSQEMASYADRKGQTLLHHVTRSLANNMAVIDRSGCEIVLDEGFDSKDTTRRLEPNDHNHAGRQLTREIVTAGADLHAVSHRRQTPLCELVRDFADAYSSKAFFFETLRNLLHNWVRDLYMARVDLEKYGSTEKALHLCGIVENTFQFNKYSAHRGELQMIFTYGPRPDSWTFWFSKQTDLFAGEFWAMVTRSAEPECVDGGQLYEEPNQGPNYHIPGSWIEPTGD